MFGLPAEVTVYPNAAERTDQDRAQVDDQPSLRDGDRNNQQSDERSGKAGERNLSGDDQRTSRASVSVGEVPLAAGTSRHA